MNPLEQSGLRWIKATRSSNLGACVEFAPCDGMIMMRDSKNPGVHLRLTQLELGALLDGAKKGEFDHLLEH